MSLQGDEQKDENAVPEICSEQSLDTVEVGMPGDETGRPKEQRAGQA